MGLFDDLIPAAQPAAAPGGAPAAPAAAGGAPAAAGLFDDLIPATPTSAAASSVPPLADEFGRPVGTEATNAAIEKDDALGNVATAVDGVANLVPFSDRAAALAAAGTGLGGKFGDYSGNLAQLRKEEGERAAAHPGMSAAGGVAGGVALAAATGGGSLAAEAGEAAPAVVSTVVPAVRAFGRKVVNGMLGGSAVGAVQGVSSSSDLTDLKQTAKDTAIGASLGGAIGGVVPAVGSAGGAIVRKFQKSTVPAAPGVSDTARDIMLSAIDKDGAANVQRNAALYGDAAMPFDYGTGLRGVAEGLATKDGPAASTIGDALGYRQAATNSRVRTGLMDNFGPAQDPAAVKAAIGDVADASTAPLFARADAAGVPWSPEAEALMQRPAVSKAMQGAAQDAANAGTPLPTVVLDASGQPVASDAAMQAYEAGQRPAVTSALADMLGADPSRGPLSLEDALTAQRKAQSDPAYAAFRDMQVPMTPELSDVLQRPSVAAALPAAERKAADQGRSIYASPANTRAPEPGAPSGASPGAAEMPDPFADLGQPYTVPPTQGAPSVQASAPPRPTGPAPVSLVSALQRDGGIQPNGETAAMGLERFPGLVRPGGLSLDQAREMAAEAGYLGGDTAHAMANTTPNDLLDALGSHPTYSVHDQDAVAARQAYADWQAGQGAATGKDYATEAVRSHLLDNGVPAGSIDPATLDLAAHFVERHGSEPGTAWEQAVMSPPFPGDAPMAPGGAASSSPPSLEARVFQQSVPIEPGHRVVPVDTDKVDALTGWQPDYRIAPGAGGPNGKLARASTFVQNLGEGQDFRPPTLGVHDQGMGFDDGRHRFAAMRDLGFKTVPVSMDPASEAAARRLGLVNEAPAAGGAVPPATPPARQLTPEGLDYVKQALDDKIAKAQRGSDPSPSDARIFGNLKSDLLGAIERHPDPAIADAYSAARQAYAAPSREIDALHAGRAAVGDAVTPEQVGREFGALGTDGERQQYRNGIFSALRDKLGKASDTANFVRTVSGSQALRDKFAAVAPHQGALDTFNGAMDRARQTFTEAQRPTAPAWRATLDRLDGAAAKGDAGAGSARDAVEAHLGQNPDFARARGIQRDYAGLQGAVDYGRGSLAGGGDPVWPAGFAERFAAMSPAEQAAVRTGQRSLMEEAVGLKPNDQLAIKGLFQTGNTPGYTAPGVTPGNPDLSGWNAQKLAAAFGEAPVGQMQELLNANDAFNSTFNGVVNNSKTARRQAMTEALADAEWKPRDLMREGHGDDTALGLIRSIAAKGINTVGHAFQSAPSNAVRDADLARIGTMTGRERDAMMGHFYDALPAYQQREAAANAVTDRTTMLLRMLAGGAGGEVVDAATRAKMLADQLDGRRRQ